MRPISSHLSQQRFCSQSEHSICFSSLSRTFSHYSQLQSGSKSLAVKIGLSCPLGQPIRTQHLLQLAFSHIHPLYSVIVRGSVITTLLDWLCLKAASLLNIIKCVNLTLQVLIPVFALGRAQELCILLETYWYDTVCSI